MDQPKIETQANQVKTETQPTKVKMDGIPAKSNAGRPSKLSPAMIQKIADCVELGLHAEQASYCVGVKYSTYTKWLHRARKPTARGIYGNLGEALVEAEQKCEEAIIKSINERIKQPYVKKTVRKESMQRDDKGRMVKVVLVEEHLPPDMASAKWLLSRRFPERWEDRQKLEIDQKNQTMPVQQVLVTVTPEPDEGTQNLLAGLQEDGTPFPEGKDTSIPKQDG